MGDEYLLQRIGEEASAQDVDLVRQVLNTCQHSRYGFLSRGRQDIRALADVWAALESAVQKTQRRLESHPAATITPALQEDMWRAADQCAECVAISINAVPLGYDQRGRYGFQRSIGGKGRREREHRAQQFIDDVSHHPHLLNLMDEMKATIHSLIHELSLRRPVLRLIEPARIHDGEYSAIDTPISSGSYTEGRDSPGRYALYPDLY
ncbi:MAG: hypothetical protein M1815_002546 [Lichina confinis]|nr:MAG: hypothetical protein M1815_002546 [Lichina confinis]